MVPFINTVTYLFNCLWLVSRHFSSQIRMTLIIIVYLPLYKSSSNNVKRYDETRLPIAPNFHGIIFVNFVINPSFTIFFFMKI